MNQKQNQVRIDRDQIEKTIAEAATDGWLLHNDCPFVMEVEGKAMKATLVYLFVSSRHFLQ